MTTCADEHERKLSTPSPRTFTPDRGCTAATGKHGTRWHVENNGCTCTTGVHDKRRSQKAQRARGGPCKPRSSWNAVATARRLQAAAVLGYGTTHLAPQLGMIQQRVLVLRNMKQPTVTDELADRIRQVVERLHHLPAPQDPPGLRLSGHKRAREHASRHGWAPLEAWLPDEIGDPHALSDLAYRRAGSSAPAAAEVAEKVALGVPIEDIARQRGVEVESVERLLSRHACNKTSRITLDDVIRARHLINSRQATFPEVAAELQISRSHLSNLLAGRVHAPVAGLGRSEAGRTTSERPPTTVPQEAGAA